MIIPGFITEDEVYVNLKSGSACLNDHRHCFTPFGFMVPSLGIYNLIDALSEGVDNQGYPLIADAPKEAEETTLIDFSGRVFLIRIEDGRFHRVQRLAHLLTFAGMSEYHPGTTEWLQTTELLASTHYKHFLPEPIKAKDIADSYKRHGGHGNFIIYTKAKILEILKKTYGKEKEIYKNVQGVK